MSEFEPNSVTLAPLKERPKVEGHYRIPLREPDISETSSFVLLPDLLNLCFLSTDVGSDGVDEDIEREEEEEVSTDRSSDEDDN